MSGRADFVSSVQAALDPAELPEPDLVILACKGDGSGRSPTRLAGHFAGATLMTVQNGLGAEEVVGAQRRLAAALLGHVHERHAPLGRTSSTSSTPRRGSGRIAARRRADAREVADLIVSSGLKAEAFDDLRPAQWSKLIFNATVNAVAALTGLPHDFHFAEVENLGDLGLLVRDLVDEGKAAAAAAGIELWEDPWEMNVLATQRGHRALPFDARGRRGAPPDGDRVDHRRARARGGPTGVPVPLHTALYRLVEGEGGVPDPVRICVVGCGAVGSLFAANLAQLDDVEVWAYDAYAGARGRDQRATGSGSRARARSSAPSGDGRPGRAAGVRLRHRRDEGDAHRRRDRRDRARLRGRLVATVQNGIGTRRCLREHVERVIRGTTFPAGKILEPGPRAVGRQGRHDARPLRAVPAARSEIERLADACTRGGMPTTAVADARGPQWRKVIFNASTNPVGALTGLTHGRVCERPDLRALVSGLVDEGKAVAAAQGIELDSDPEALIDHAASPRSPTTTGVMLQDVEARRTTESTSERRYRPLRAPSTACRRR